MSQNDLALQKVPLPLRSRGPWGAWARLWPRRWTAALDAVVFSRFDRPGATGEGLSERDEALKGADVAVDFTIPRPRSPWPSTPPRMGAGLVIGSTGFTDEQNARIAAAATKVAIVKSGNYSLGVNMLMGLVRQAAAALPARD